MLGIDQTNVKKIAGVSRQSYTNDLNKILSAMGSNDTVPDDIVSENYSAENTAELKKHFPEEEGTRTDTFSKYTNKMVAAYNIMSETIEEKYADPNHETEYYIAPDGRVQELTKEKEQEMLDQAYSRQSEFMATSMEIWNDLSGVEMYTHYDSGKTVPHSMPEGNGKNAGEKIVNAPKGEIKNAVYQAFMSAIGGNNVSKLMGTGGSWNHVKLDLDVSSSQASCSSSRTLMLSSSL